MVRTTKNLSRLAAAGAALMLTLSACGGGDDGADSNVIVVGGTGTSFPHSCVEDGELTGFDTDVITEAAERAGYTVEFQTMDFPGLMGSVSSGRIDTTGTNLTWTEERSETYVFTRAYAYGGVVLSTGGDNDAIQTADDLAGKVIATGAGSTNETATLAWIEETGNGATVRAYDGPQQARTDTQLGRTDGYASPISSISAMIAVQDVDMRIVSEFLTFEQTRFPFADTERGRQLAADISGALDEMEEDGTLTDISAKYFDDDLTVPTEDHMVPDPYSGTFPGGAE